jgi:adenylate cyclase
LGDPVSVAARLEGQTKGYGVKLIVGPKTVDICKNDFDWWELDNIAVKGKEEPLKIFTVRKQTPEHREFLNYYYVGEWDKALNNIQNFVKSAKDMKPYYENMAKRLSRGKPHDWDGIYRATSK